MEWERPPACLKLGLLGCGVGASALVSTRGEGGQVNGSAPPRCEARCPPLLSGIKRQRGTHSFFRMPTSGLAQSSWESGKAPEPNLLSFWDPSLHVAGAQSPHIFSCVLQQSPVAFCNPHEAPVCPSNILWHTDSHITYKSHALLSHASLSRSSALTTCLAMVWWLAHWGSVVCLPLEYARTSSTLTCGGQEGAGGMGARARTMDQIAEEVPWALTYQQMTEEDVGSARPVLPFN